MRLIDADEIKYTEYINGDVTVSKDKINALPTIEAEPVVHAHWTLEKFKNVFSSTGYGYRITCSHCGECFTVTEESYKNELYCRHCGAKMGGDLE